MRRNFSLLFFIFILSQISFSQQQEDPYVPFAEVMPQPIGGIAAIYKQIQYPEAARQAHLEGKVYVLALINENGHVDDVKIVKGLGLGCDKAAADAIKRESFTPAKNNGVAVKAKLTIAIEFKLSN